MIRHSVFALVLVGAAFAGGAAINGPGLTWLQRTVLGGPTIIVDGAPGTPSHAPKKPGKPFPAVKPSPLVVDLPRAPQPRSTSTEPAAQEPEPPLPAGSPSAPASALIRPVEPPAPDLGPTPASEPAPAPVRQASATARPKAPAGPDLGLMPKADPVARLASTEPASAPTAPAASPDWAEIRKRMQALGIARYSMEAEVDGRVRFSCVIPLDGLRAVGHQFEAEGDDEYQAAEAALRRVTLWQATEPAPKARD